MEQTAISVSELNAYVSTLLSSDSVLCQLCVKGEISGYKRYPSGHAYFQLKDESSSVSCVMFKGNFSHIDFVPENGMKVRIYGRAGIYAVDGKFQVYVSFMQEDGLGELFKEFELRKERMAKEGLFDESHKKPIPYLPKRIGVVTSPKGAVIQDIINVLNRRFPNYDLLIAPSAVQGKEASAELIKGLKMLDSRDDIDVIIIARGGGSMEDLWCFNDEALGRAIYEAETPVISAVGHETDYTICDFCSDLRAPTPSAAAELVMPNKEEILSRLDVSGGKLALAMRNFMKNKSHQWESLTKHRALLAPRFRIEKEMQRCDVLSSKLSEKMTSSFEKKKGIFTTDLAKLGALDPMKVLLRGYSRVTDTSGKTVDSVKCVNIKDEVVISVSDGTIRSTVSKVEPKEGE
ncbi:MAG: exodeoxyribonuclease VII large subunit [Saccharofermentanaceae bacterium]|nr:exodeoxyribonuclease VII large subunit [Saccharofermentanaceae bacterium]HAU51363.1 exodeoxyribonuclease VII large subunit [Clostridiales bacterium]